MTDYGNHPNGKAAMKQYISFTMTACKVTAGIGFRCSTPKSGAPHRRAGWLRRILRRLDAKILAHVPMGYQDENGFHYGAQPEKKAPSNEKR